MQIVHVVGARPNFMKVAPVLAALGRVPGLQQRLIHTGQHYDANMSQVFFRQMGIPQPEVNLEVGSGSHARQTAEILVRFEKVVEERRPDMVVVYGDVNSTLAVALVCAKLSIPLAHVEAGLRSRDRSMPEEINRLVTDQLADLLFTPSSDGDENLACEGVHPDRIHLVGNVMVDTLVRMLPAARELWENGALKAYERKPYMLVTLHRPSNVDDPQMLASLVAAMRDFARDVDVLWPVHPRTRQRMQEMGLTAQAEGLHLTEPLGYVEFLALQMRAALVVTDSGGVQEETTYLGVPCLTLRENTERPTTILMGTNTLLGRDVERLRAEVGKVLAGGAKEKRCPPLWDGKASERIARILVAWIQERESPAPPRLTVSA